MNFDWQTFRAKLMMEGKTIKQWLKENKIDSDRYKNIRYKQVVPTKKELALFNKVLEEGE